MLLATVRPFRLLAGPPHRRAGPAGRHRLMPPAPDSAGGSAGRELDAETSALVAAMARGDKTALARLYDALARPLYSLAYRVTNDASEAQDIIQDVFLQLWRTAADYDTGRGSVFSWAATLTRNRAIDRIRMRKRRAELLAGAAPELQPAAGDGTDSAASLWGQEKAGAVRAALTRLEPGQQAAIELAYFGGLTQQEIATRLNEPLGTIKARIRRGLLKLREALPARL